MIPEEIHSKLVEKWKGRKYATRERVEERERHLEGLLPLLAGKEVLELGSNAGVTAYDVCKYAKGYVGVEPDKDHYEQALLMMPHLPQGGAFMHGSLQDYLGSCEGNHNALIVCIALYLLSRKEVDLLESGVLPKCDVVIIQERTAKRPCRENYNPLKLHKPKNIVKLLERNGFDACVYYSAKKKYFEVIGANKGNGTSRPVR